MPGLRRFALAITLAAACRLTRRSQARAPGARRAAPPTRCDIVAVGTASMSHRCDRDTGCGAAGGSGGDGEPGGAVVLEGGDLVDVAERQADVVEALHQPPAGVVVELEGG